MTEVALFFFGPLVRVIQRVRSLRRNGASCVREELRNGRAMALRRGLEYLGVLDENQSLDFLEKQHRAK